MMASDNVTILLISSSKLLKNKFIECLGDGNSNNQFTLMNKSIESLKSQNERVSVPCLICDYLTDQAANESNSNMPPETIYVQLVDAAEKNLINNLVSRSVNAKEAMSRNFQFNVNAIVYLFDETNSDTFAYVQAIHKELQKTFKPFVNNENVRFLLCNMIGATISTTNNGDDAINTSCSTQSAKQVESFLEEFNNNLQVFVCLICRIFFCKLINQLFFDVMISSRNTQQKCLDSARFEISVITNKKQFQ